VVDDTTNLITGGIFFSAVIQGSNVTVHLPREVTPALSGLPARPAVFVGRRADADEVLDGLAPQVADPQQITGAPVSVAAIAGMPGVGKTELAVHAARAALRGGWFPGGALFADMMGYDPDRRREPAEALDGLLRALGVPGENIPAFEEDRARLYASVLSKYAEEGRRILVVIDNASSAEQVKPLLPTDEASRAIVTSRDDLGMPGTRLVDLKVLTPEESVQLLDRALHAARPSDTRVTGAAEAAALIADLCAGLPLALQIIAALLAEDPNRSLPAMAADLSTATSLLEEMQIGARAVRAAFNLSYQRLDPQRARLFRLLPVNSGPDLLIASTAALAGTGNHATRHDLEALARAHLIERGAPHGGCRRWRMHDLLRLYARQLSDADADADGREEARDRLLIFYLDMAEAADARLRPGRPVTTEFSSPAEALVWLDAERPNLVAAVTMAAENGRHETAFFLSNRLAEYFDLRRRFDEKVATTLIGLEAARYLRVKENEATALGILGGTLAQIGRLEEAITACQGAIVISQEIDDRHGEGMATGNLGRALREMGRFEEAITAFQQAIFIFRDTGDRHDEGNAVDNLGTALSLAGRVEEAISAYEDAAAIYHEIGYRHGEGVCLGNLGSTLHEVGRFEDAITACQGAVVVFRETGYSYGEGMSLSYLGEALLKAGQSEEAVTAYEGAAAIFQGAGHQAEENEVIQELERIRASRQA
jgi:tetratricopeptide (TPR) repeat protein